MRGTPSGDSSNNQADQPAANPIGETVWISFGESDGYTLHPAHVLGRASNEHTADQTSRHWGSLSQSQSGSPQGSQSGSIVARFAGSVGRTRGCPETLPSSLDDREAVVYFNGPSGFMQQPARIVSADPEQDGAVRIEPTGIAAIAEDRVSGRIGLATAGHGECSAVVAGGDVCQIADVSRHGLSVVSAEVYAHGQVVKVGFEAGAQIFSGMCTVRRIAPVRDLFRYGLVAVDGVEGGTLATGLAALTESAEVHRARRFGKVG